MKKFLEPEEMSICKDKIELYKDEESVNFDELKRILNRISSAYSTDNTSIINNLNLELTRNMNKINKIHDNNVFVINERIEAHLELERNNVEILSGDDIDGQRISVETKL